jgi:hypothetical protein
MPKFDFHSDKAIVSDVEVKKPGSISEYDRLLAAKQILLGLAILFFTTQVIFLILPDKANPLLEINKIVLPSLATLIIAFYFRDTRGH